MIKLTLLIGLKRVRKIRWLNLLYWLDWKYKIQDSKYKCKVWKHESKRVENSNDLWNSLCSPSFLFLFFLYKEYWRRNKWLVSFIKTCLLPSVLSNLQFLVFCLSKFESLVFSWLALVGVKSCPILWLG